ncbi:MAG: hypothetical protein NXI31_23225 [bacterium]|nr:hypothetical protein [bacterium]
MKPTNQLPTIWRTTARAMLLAAAPTFLMGTATADELRLDDGRVLVGKVVEKKKEQVYEIHTRDGLVVVPAAKVAEHTKDAALRLRLADAKKNADSSAFSFLQLAIRAHSYGLSPEMWRNLETAIKKHNDAAQRQQASAALGRQLHKFLASLESEILPLKWRSANTQTRVRKLVQQVKLTNQRAKLLAIREILTREPNADAALRKEARRNTLPYRRIAALEALAQRARNEQARGQQQQYRFVLRTAILDGDQTVRKAAMRIAREHEQDTTDSVHYLAGGLVHKLAKVRIRTAEAFAELGHPEAVKQLVLAGPSAAAGLVANGGGGGGTRGHIAILTQQAYIRDFDVEVAQAAFIADPKVDVLQSGTVLDVTVAGVFEERVIVRAYRKAIRRLAQSTPPRKTSDWASWYADREAKAASADKAATTGKR